ncbi:hypothetical protein KBD81_03020 [Candidatus Woesebacteria bacterium]|nr:hypothetical protein [Candidatus Woesebacteria bacterium]
MAEFLSGNEILNLSPDWRLKRGQNTRQKIEQVESAVGAYVEIDLDRFAGFMCEPQGLGPETPRYFPSEADRTDNIQAAAQIGTEWKYWDLVRDSQVYGFINPLNVISSQALPLKMNEDGTIAIYTAPSAYRAAIIANISTIRSDHPPKYAAVVVPVQYAGGHDFYNSLNEGEIPLGSAVSKFINTASIGLEQSELAADTYDSWLSVLDNAERNFRTAIEQCWSSFPTYIQNINGLANFRSSTHFASMLTRAGLEDDSYNYVYQILEAHAAGETFDNRRMIEALQNHSRNLKQMYEEVKNFLEGIYIYK